MALIDPTTLGFEFYRTSEIIYMPVWKDHAGNATIINTAKGLYPKPIVEPVSVGIYKCTKWDTNYSDSDFSTELNATNSDTWRGWTARKAWISSIETRPDDVQEISCTRVDYTIRCLEYGWDAIFPDCGYFYKTGSDYKTFVDTDGAPYLGKLNGSGDKATMTANPTINTHQIKRAINFGTTLPF